MKNSRAIDINGVRLRRGDVVEIRELREESHNMLRKGNTLRVAYWEDHSKVNEEYISVYLKPQWGGRVIAVGVHDKRLEIKGRS